MNQKEFFDQIAKDWDNRIEVNEGKINTLLSKISIKDKDKILDVGTGTGVLIPFLTNLNPNGYIKGVDISKGMLEVASDKFKNYKNVSFEITDVEKDTIDDRYDKIILYSMFPHLQNKTMTIKSLVKNNLKKDGKLIIAHSNSREFLNNMHKDVDESVSEDRLIPIDKQRNLFEEIGLDVEQAFENDEIYYIVIKK